MNQSKCPHCGVKLGNFRYADACPHCHTELTANTRPLIASTKKSHTPMGWPGQWFCRFVRLVES
jgi:hypothetical protein